MDGLLWIKGLRLEGFGLQAVGGTGESEGAEIERNPVTDFPELV